MEAIRLAMVRFACCSRRHRTWPHIFQKWVKFVERVVEKHRDSVQSAIHHPRVINELRGLQRLIEDGGDASPEVLLSQRRLARWKKFIIRFRRTQKIRRRFAAEGYYLNQYVHPSIRAALKRAYPTLYRESIAAEFRMSSLGIIERYHD